MKQIVHTKTDSIRDIPLDRSVAFPKLEATTLAFEGCMAPQSWAFSPSLKRVNINVGFNAGDQQALLDRSNAVAKFLQHAGMHAPNLRTLQIRGRMTDSLNLTVAGLTQLRVLTIQGNCFLQADTLAAIAQFPALESLDVHASQVEANEFEDALLAGPDAPCFPALKNLTIRASGALLSAVIAHLPCATLVTLRADLEACSSGPSHVQPVLELLAQRAHASLVDLTFEDRTDPAELDTPPSSPPCWYTLGLLAPLARLKALKRATLPHPDLQDADLETLGKWWPALVYLHLGTLDADDGESGELPVWRTRMTPAAYSVAAKTFKHLESLALPAHLPDAVDGSAAAELAQQSKLCALVVGDVPDAGTRAVGIVDALLEIFPKLMTLDCHAAEVTERFETVLASRRL